MQSNQRTGEEAKHTQKSPGAPDTCPRFALLPSWFEGAANRIATTQPPSTSKRLRVVTLYRPGSKGSPPGSPLMHRISTDIIAI